MIRVYIGISGSGKTTRCKADMRENTNAVRVNRDDIRTAIYGLDYSTYRSYFSREDYYQCEQFVSDIENRIISRAISKGMDVYADNTHLKQKYIKKYYQYGVDVELVWCDVDLVVAKERDFKREDHFVGFDVIETQYEKYNILKKNWQPLQPKEQPKIENNPQKPWCYVFDIDGTLAEKSDRSPYDYSRVMEDGLRTAVFETLNAISYFGVEKIYLCSGRDGSCRNETIQWLKENKVYYDDLFMREAGDKRPDWQVKEEMWKHICENHYIVAMFDDRNQVVDHARSLGFDVFQVNYGDF